MVHTRAHICKKRRYADVYTRAFDGGKRKLQRLVSTLLDEFRCAPVWNLRVPHHVHTLLTTQSLADELEVSREPLGWAFRLVRLIERRAARVIARAYLDHLYKPGGWWHRLVCRSWPESWPEYGTQSLQP